MINLKILKNQKMGIDIDLENIDFEIGELKTKIYNYNNKRTYINEQTYRIDNEINSLEDKKRELENNLKDIKEKIENFNIEIKE